MSTNKRKGCKPRATKAITAVPTRRVRKATASARLCPRRTKIPNWFKLYTDEQKRQQEQLLATLTTLLQAPRQQDNGSSSSRDSNWRPGLVSVSSRVVNDTSSEVEGEVIQQAPPAHTGGDMANIAQLLRGLVANFPPLPPKPTFDGSPNKNPVQFLEKVEAYGKALRQSGPELLETALSCLKGPASNWTKVYQRNWGSFAEFKQSFLRFYWSDDKQREVRRRISSESYNPSRGRMADHFTHFVNQASLLTDPIPEATLVSELMHHFPLDIQQLWALKGEGTLVEAADFLMKQDFTIESHQQATRIPQNTPYSRPAPANQNFNRDQSRRRNNPVVGENTTPRVNQEGADATQGGQQH